MPLCQVRLENFSAARQNFLLVIHPTEWFPRAIPRLGVGCHRY
jgi:hypothetical protein